MFLPLQVTLPNLMLKFNVPLIQNYHWITDPSGPCPFLYGWDRLTGCPWRSRCWLRWSSTPPPARSWLSRSWQRCHCRWCEHSRCRWDACSHSCHWTSYHRPWQAGNVQTQIKTWQLSEKLVFTFQKQIKHLSLAMDCLLIKQ